MEGDEFLSPHGIFEPTAGERVSMPFFCDLEEGHKGNHVSNSNPPKKIAEVIWPRDEYSGD